MLFLFASEMNAQNCNQSAIAGCLHIQSILVDAVKNPEGENEAFYFKVGPNQLDLTKVDISFPNGNSFSGFTKTSGTTSWISGLGFALKKCVKVFEQPQSNKIPANANVLVFTNTNVNTGSLNFSLLRDSTYVLFLNSTDTTDFFPNWSNVGNCQLAIRVSGCGGDSVTYERNKLLNQSGQTSAFNTDGSRVDFADDGTPIYLIARGRPPGGITNFAGKDTTICYGSSFQVSTRTKPGACIQWFGGDGTFTDSSQATTTYNPGTWDTTLVKLYVKAIYACDTLVDTLTININDVNISAGTGTVICYNQTASLQAISNNGTSFQWKGGTGTFSNPKSLSTQYTPGSGELGDVWLSITASNSCYTRTDSVKVVVVNSTNVDAGNNYILCQSAAIFLQGKADYAYTVKWGTTNGSGFFSNKNVLNPFYSTGKNDTDEVILWLSATGPCGTETDTVKLLINKKPIPQVGRDTIICRPGIIELDGSGTYIDSIQWKGGTGTFSNPNSYKTTYTPGAGDAGLFYLLCYGYNTCGSAYDSVLVGVYDKPTAFAGNDTTACTFQSLPLYTAAVQYGTAVWTTTGKGTFQNPALVQTVYHPDPGDTGVQYLKLSVTGPCGTAVDSVKVTFLPGPDPTFSGLRSPLCISNDPIQLVPKVPGGTFSGKKINGDQFLPDSAGTFTIIYTVNKANGCTSSDTQTVVVNSAGGPTADFTTDPTQPNTGETFQTINNSSNANSYAWYWMKDGVKLDSSILQAPTFVGKEEGNYTLCLTAKATNGCIDSVCIDIPISSQEQLEFPNVITVNGDGLNDSLTWVAKSMKEFDLSVYNRWGEKLYHTVKADEYWYPGETPAGTYYFVIIAKGKSGKSYDRKGVLTLIR